MDQHSALKQHKTYINYLPEVQAYLNELEHQDLWWSTVGMVGKINNENIDPQLLVSIVDTQEEFQKLRDIMIKELIGRYLNQANSEIMLKAQTTIDILIRNLFERTADVGFLATDDDLVEFMSNQNTTDSDKDFIMRRIQEYVAKYTVYDDVLLVTPTGEIKAKLDQSNPAQQSFDPLINKALITDEDYIEVYRYSDLFPNKPSSLVYAKKIVDTTNGEAKTVGVLCLSFLFEDEMQGIFKSLSGQNSYALSLLDDTEKVIASSNSQKYPIGKSIRKLEDPTQPEKIGNSLRFYCKTNGYQDFYGLPWSGYAEIDMNAAFNKNKDKKDLGVEIPKDSPLYLKDLEEVNLRVSTLLLTVILNGKIMSLKRDVKSFLPILDRFQIISLEIQDIFSRFIHHIHQVLVDTIQSKVAFSAALAIEVMDRNLYERANDCRWWALNSRFRKILSSKNNTGQIEAEQSQNLTDILTYINELYTVYTNIILYDKTGQVLAVSNPNESHLVGSIMPRPADTSECLKLDDTQAYAVSDFHQTPLYNNEHTYIYHAPVKDWENMALNVGGIALVFDSKPEFEAMLHETEPKYLNPFINKSTFSVLIDQSANVISTSNPDIKIGQHLNLPAEILNAPAGQNDTVAWEWNNTTYLVGYKASNGYREYKNGDGYTNHVIALVCTGV